MSGWEAAVAVPAADGSHTEKRKMTVSERTIPALTAALREWLAGRLAPDRPTVSEVAMPNSGGLSSTSVLFEASWPGEGSGIAGHSGRYVARMAPEPSARGRIPPDNPPYVFTGWLLDAAPEDRARLQSASVAILAKVHAIPEPAARFPGLRPPAGVDALRYHLAQQEDYYRWALSDDGLRIPIIERSLVWLEEHWPRDPGPDVLCWGDARIGNIIYRGFEPAAVLDWEMAALGPRELDVGWFVFLHRFFQDIAEFFEQPGLPDFLRRSDVERCYTELTGRPLRDMDFYLTYAALRHAIVMARIKRRMIHFGEDQPPDDPDDYVMHRASLEKLLAGTYRWD
jgi:aminoglycoside phosphotransferase (APT) family kinase protein